MRPILSVFLSFLLIPKILAEAPDLSYLNTSADPCDDFYKFTCGNFKNVHPRPADTMIVDNFLLLSDEILKITENILLAPNKKHDPVAVKKARSAYKSCIDTEYMDTLKNPELMVIDEVQGFPMVTSNEYHEFGWNDIGRLAANYGVVSIFTVTSYPHPTDKSKMSILIQLTNDVISNPSLFRTKYMENYEENIDRALMEMCTRKDARKLQELQPFDIFLRNVTMKLKAATNNYATDDAQIYQNLEDMADFMRKLYGRGIMDKDDDIPEFPAGKSSITIKEMQEWTDLYYKGIQINWLEYLTQVYSRSYTVIDESTELFVYNNMSTSLYKALNLVRLTNPNIVKNYALMRIFLYNAPDSDASTRAAFEKYYTDKNFTVYPRNQYCLRRISDLVGTVSMSFAVTHEYQRLYFNVNKLGKAASMIEDLQTAFIAMLQQNDWLADESKAKALQKVYNMVTILAYPEVVDDISLLDKFYENLQICTWDNYGNARRIRALRQGYQLSALQQRDRSFWDKSPLDVNAYYNRPNNKIVFPIAILNPIFFYGDDENAFFDYARIGSIIGHEITHGFDASGSIYNEEGVIEVWWTANDTLKFKSKTSCYEKQYSCYYIEQIGVYVNGTTTLNENLADNGGLKMAYNAFKSLNLSGNGQATSFTNEQLFFIGYGTLWCNEASDAYLEWLQTNPHAEASWRTNGVVSNMPEFSEAFNCPAGSKMNPISKCDLW